MTGPHPHRTVTVVGGRGAVGAMYAEAFRADGADVHVVDPASSPGGDITAPSDAVTATVRASDIVVLAVPEPVALHALPALVTMLGPDALVVDTLSVKTDMSRIVAAAAPSCGVVGVNPMFAPSLGMTGRATAVVVYHSTARAVEFVDRLTRWGTRTVPVSADDHDRTVATTQALTHAAVLAYGTAAARLGVDPEMAAALGPPPHATLSALLARVSTGTPEVYHDVQHGNPFAQHARDALADAVRDIDSAAATEPTFAAAMTVASSALGSRAEDYRRHCATLFTVPFDPAPSEHV